MIELPRNGQVWESPSYMRAISQYITKDTWMLLGLPNKAMHGGTCMLAFSDPDGSGRVFYSNAELQARLDGWRLLRVEEYRDIAEAHWIALDAQAQAKASTESKPE